MRWRALLRPIPDGTRRGFVPVTKPRQAPPPLPTVEEFVSPLRQDLRTLLDTKQAIGYAGGCPQCRRQSQQDERLAAAASAKEDTAPYLAATREELIKVRHSEAELIKKLEDAKRWQQPMTRLRLSIYTAAATGTILTAFSVVRWILGLP